MGIEERTWVDSPVWSMVAGAACLVGALAAVWLVAVYGVETMMWDATHGTWAYVARPLAEVVTVLGIALAAILVALGAAVMVRALRRGWDGALA
ncbi:hypothetical protein [Microbacterium oleivorans]|uniref:Uncharacterized protein n=1 Tax=Microbacterium oleivorans TaxID=273677 RepID=A0A031FTS8_9MICO|nr:hypothetical protein [Microbacterium oleivorans]AZS42555.1 hypothetical protein BWL13_00089 [Microbacterium oleivorans]EZP27601.1 hypothetical protein BW34_01590 [Microbacterium oleivorans]THE07953.1 hypothetical protein E1I21_05070 [Microbacterium oleivorans]